MKPLPAHALRCPVHGIEMTALVGHGFAQRRRGCEWTTLVHHCRLCHDEAVARIRVETEAFASACRRRARGRRQLVSWRHRKDPEKETPLMQSGG
jgi:hypothetical protein